MIARLCRRAVGSRDYVLSILREAIGGKGLFLAWCGRELVGITNFERCMDGSGWLSIARTDPDWRRKGVARFLQRQIISHAKQSGITTLRLWASSKNKPSISAIRKGGFRKVCEAAYIRNYLRTKNKDATIRPLSRASETRLESFLRSRYLSQMNWYFAYKRHFVKANRAFLRRILRKRELYKVGESVFVLTRPRRTFSKLQSSLILLDGPISESLRNSKKVAKELGAQVIGGYIPYNRYQLMVAKRLGFKPTTWGEHCLVFERPL